MAVILHPAAARRSEAPRLLERMRQAIRVRHYSIRTEEAYLAWVRRFFAFTRRHPRDLEADEINRFLTHLAIKKNVAASTQRQALSAILFLYRNVLKIDPPWIDNIVRARQPKRLPTVLSREEVAVLLAQLEGTVQLVVMLLYGTGMRILECLRLRIQSADFDLGVITIRTHVLNMSGGKGVVSPVDTLGNNTGEKDAYPIEHPSCDIAYQAIEHPETEGVQSGAEATGQGQRRP